MKINAHPLHWPWIAIESGGDEGARYSCGRCGVAQALEAGVTVSPEFVTAFIQTHRACKEATVEEA